MELIICDDSPARDIKASVEKLNDPRGHCVLGERQPLVVCDTHTAEEIETAHKRWQSRDSKELYSEQEDE